MSSRTPDGGYMPTFASNFMMDGFNFSEEYGEGSATARKDSTTSRTTGAPAPPRSQHGMSALPDGFVTAAQGDSTGWDIFGDVASADLGDLSDMVKKANQITDLSWLEDVEQDPSRLPRSPNDRVLQELTDAWGANRRTDGVNFVPNVVMPPQPRSPVAQLPGDQYREIVASAMRKSAFGAPFESIVAGVAAHLGEAMSRVHTDPRLQKLAQALRSVKAEHGLVGRVYVRDSAFPGLLTGKWNTEIKKRCASARYWLTRPGSKLSAMENYLGKKVVTEIPWREALAHYRPILEASGRKVAAGDPREALLSAMTSNPVATKKEANHTYHVAPADRVTAEQAWKVFANAPPPVREVVARPAPGMTEEDAAGHLTRWIQAGLLTEKFARQVMTSSHTPEYKVGYCAWAIQNPAIMGRAAAAYGGAGVGVKLLQAGVQNAAWAKEETARIAAYAAEHRHRVAQQKIAGVFAAWVKSGALTQSLADKVMARNLSPEDAIRLGSMLVNRVRKTAYRGQGEGRTVFTGGPEKVQGPAKDPKVGQVLRYASEQMNEGVAGRDLDSLLVTRFSQEYLKNAGEQLVQLRRKHEGLAGHLYVDASAYASPTGTSGCDNGALIHRASPVRAVLQMDRCGSCSQNSGGSCQKYRKSLVASAPVENPEKYQREAIKLANADDSVRTAAMFDPGEYGLRNDAVDFLDLKNLPTASQLNGITFEGMLVPGE